MIPSAGKVSPRPNSGLLSAPVQVADFGAPLQVIETDWLIAVPEVSASWYCAA
jgi:hypothetical protein